LKDPDPDPYLWLVDPELDPGGPKTFGSGYRSGRLVQTLQYLDVVQYLWAAAFYFLKVVYIYIIFQK
jgi:hypothetical protein